MNLSKELKAISEHMEKIEEQMKKAEVVVLSFKDGRMKMKFKNASIATYGFIICEFLTHVAEEHPDMVPSLRSACNTFLECPEVSDDDE